MRIRVHRVFQKILCVDVVLWINRGNVELSHSSYDSLDAIQNVFVDGQAVEAKLLWCIAVLVDDLHLLDDRRFTAFSGTCSYTINRTIIWVGLEPSRGFPQVMPTGETNPIKGSCIPSVTSSNPLLALHRWPDFVSSSPLPHHCLYSGRHPS